MRTLLLGPFLILASTVAEGQSPGGTPDTEAAAHARATQLKTKVTLDAQGQPLIDFLKEVAAEAEKQLVKPPKWTYAPEASQTERITYRCKDKPIEDVLAEVFKAPGLGYVIVSAPDHKLDGFVRITKGNERGYAMGTEPTAADRQAMAKLETAKTLLKDGKKTTAKAVLSLLVKSDPNSPVGKEAARLLESIDK